MKIIEGKHINYIGRLIYIDNTIHILSMLLYSFLIYNFKPINDFKYLFMFLLIITFLFIYYLKARTIVNKISFDENNLYVILEGESLNKIWRKSISIKESKISIIENGSRRGICGSKFYLYLKFESECYKINYFQNFTEIELLNIFEEFKIKKEEKIIIDEKLVLNRIEEKITKCQ